MNKFRIVEQRGVFRIEMTQLSLAGHGETMRLYRDGVDLGDVTPQGIVVAIDFIASGKWYKPDTKVLTCVEVLRPTYEEKSSLLLDDKFLIVKFDTYKKAENYIKKFYGSTGVDAIEKPEWQVK